MIDRRPDVNYSMCRRHRIRCELHWGTTLCGAYSPLNRGSVILRVPGGVVSSGGLKLVVGCASR